MISLKHPLEIKGFVIAKTCENYTKKCPFLLSQCTALSGHSYTTDIHTYIHTYIYIYIYIYFYIYHIYKYIIIYNIIYNIYYIYLHAYIYIVRDLLESQRLDLVLLTFALV